MSPATVDRALNGRGGVSQAALFKIDAAVRDLGFGASTRLLTHQLRPKVSLRFILPKGAGGFVQAIKAALTATSYEIEEVDVSVEFDEIKMEPDVIAERLAAAGQAEIDAVGLFAMDTPEVRDAIDASVAAGMPVLTMVSDVPAAHRTTFVGIDNNAAGRTAGRLMGKFLRYQTGKVAVIAGSMKVRDHMERFFAFRDIISRDFRNISVLPVCETRSLDRYNMDCVQGLMASHEDLVGIYLVTGGVSGVLAALREVEERDRPAFIAHDISPSTRRGLIAGEIDAVINQSAEKIAEAAVSILLYDLVPGRTRHTATKAGIGIEIFLAENLP